MLGVMPDILLGVMLGVMPDILLGVMLGVMPDILTFEISECQDVRHDPNHYTSQISFTK